MTSVEPDRDEFEFALLHAAREARSAGLRHLPRPAGDERRARRHARPGHQRRRWPASVAHTVPTPPCAIAHEVWVSKGSRLWTLMQEKMADADTCSVNSRHHQAVKRLAPGFDVTATAPDGVIEAIECANVRRSASASSGIPENFWRTGEFRPLFEGFIEACRKSHGLEDPGPRRSSAGPSQHWQLMP